MNDGFLGGAGVAHGAERTAPPARLAGAERVAESTGSTAFGPTVSVSFEYFAEQSVESTSPERTDSWMFAVWAAEPPRKQSTQTTSVGGLTDRPARLMKRFELISDSPAGRSRCAGRAA